jgi:hypothetical protein
LGPAPSFVAHRTSSSALAAVATALNSDVRHATFPIATTCVKSQPAIA